MRQFRDLQLDVKGCQDIYASFDKYVEVECLEGDNKYQSEEHGLQDLRSRIIGHKQQVAKQEISRLKYLIKTMKGVVLEDDIEGKKLIDEMKGYLKTAEAQLESCKF